MMAQIGVLLLCLLALACLMLAMPVHVLQLVRAPLGKRQLQGLRVIGWLLLCAALFLAVQLWQFDIGLVNWLGWLTVVGLGLIFVFPYLPWRQREPERNKRREQAPSLPAIRAPVLMLLAMLLPAGYVLWQFYLTPEKPLLRDDVYSATIGPWQYELAEKNTKAPEITPLGLGVKEFVLAFCESCNAEIRTAYLKLREPRSLRAAGNSFGGGRERGVEIAIPPHIQLSEGLWLTVVSKKGEVYQQRLDIARISPSMAQLIEQQLGSAPAPHARTISPLEEPAP